MSFDNNADSGHSSYVYQPPFVIRLVVAFLLVFATFAIPYALFTNTSNSTAVENTPPPADSGDTGAMVPAMLTFDSDTSIPATATFSLATPYEGGWDITSQEEGITVYNYTPLSCVVTTKVTDETFANTGKDASMSVLSDYLGTDVASSGSAVSISELTYNITNTAQVVGIGSSKGGQYEWTYARALTPIGKGVIISVACSSKEAMYEAADTLRSQFGILLKP